MTENAGIPDKFAALGLTYDDVLLLPGETDVVPAENPAIVNRYNELLSIVDPDTRLEAEARAKVWAEQFPASLNH